MRTWQQTIVAGGASKLATATVMRHIVCAISRIHFLNY